METYNQISRYMHPDCVEYFNQDMLEIHHLMREY